MKDIKKLIIIMLGITTIFVIGVLLIPQEEKRHEKELQPIETQAEIDMVWMTNKVENMELINIWADKYNWPILAKDSNAIECGTPFYCNPDSFSVHSWYPLIHIWDSSGYLHTYDISRIKVNQEESNE